MVFALIISFAFLVITALAQPFLNGEIGAMQVCFSNHRNVVDVNKCCFGHIFIVFTHAPSKFLSYPRSMCFLQKEVYEVCMFHVAWILQVYSLVTHCTTLLYGILLSIQDLTTVQQATTTAAMKYIFGQILVTMNLIVFFFPAFSRVYKFLQLSQLQGESEIWTKVMKKVKDMAKKLLKRILICFEKPARPAQAEVSRREAEKWSRSLVPFSPTFWHLSPSFVSLQEPKTLQGQLQYVNEPPASGLFNSNFVELSKDVTQYLHQNLNSADHAEGACFEGINLAPLPQLADNAEETEIERLQISRQDWGMLPKTGIAVNDVLPLSLPQQTQQAQYFEEVESGLMSSNFSAISGNMGDYLYQNFHTAGGVQGLNIDGHNLVPLPAVELATSLNQTKGVQATEQQWTVLPKTDIEVDQLTLPLTTVATELESPVPSMQFLHALQYSNLEKSATQSEHALTSGQTSQFKLQEIQGSFWDQLQVTPLAPIGSSAAEIQPDMQNTGDQSTNLDYPAPGIQDMFWNRLQVATLPMEISLSLNDNQNMPDAQPAELEVEIPLETALEKKSKSLQC